MKNFNGTPEEAWAERKRLCKEHGINMIRAGCYLNNYYNEFLCEDCNVEKCRAIHESAGEVTGADIGEDSVTEATDGLGRDLGCYLGGSVTE